MSAPESASRGTRMKVALRPAVPAAGLFITGVVLHPIAPHRPAAWIILTALLAACGWLSVKRPRTSSALLAAALVAAAISAAQLYAYQFRGNDVSAFAGDEARLAWLEMEIVTPPRVLTDPFNPARAIP